ncbi:hypothetical protein BIW11_11457 [Tropilaelaps mercedesae]|uniref:Uncharacterized protein n=1 Tax=Tropilaelaps mercedesae TaxID=418985 RepID=A0A1V9XBI6_9ACAR|nr:hypothetical protein BIW11_11457 [Tropilaelaps mercedesae]
MDQTQFYSVISPEDEHEEMANEYGGDEGTVSKESEKQQHRPPEELHKTGEKDYVYAAKENVHPDGIKRSNQPPSASTSVKVKFDDNPIVTMINLENRDDVLADLKNGPTKELTDVATVPQQLKSTVDRFKQHFGASGAPSPIKPLPAVFPVSTADLKINGTFVVADRVDGASKCIQPDGSEISFDQPVGLDISEGQPADEMPSEVTEDLGRIHMQQAEKSAEDDQNDVAKISCDTKNIANRILSRKHSQTETSAAFKLLHAKFPHKNAPNSPEFRGDSPPQINFGHEDVFRARLSSKDACVQNLQSFEEEMSVQEFSANFETVNGKEGGHVSDFTRGLQSASGTVEGAYKPVSAKDPIAEMPEEANEKEIEFKGPFTDLNRTATDYFNKTLDMTLRTSGAAACGLGLLLAFDEMLDPAVSPLLPYGLRRRGANVIIFLVSVLLAMLIWFFLL